MQKQLILGVASLMIIAGCRSANMTGRSAVANVEARSDSSAHGTVTFSEMRDDRIDVKIDLSGLAPNSTHGFHVHEKGDCSAPDASSAGGHFNPSGAPHGAMADAQHHAGDFGNIVADANGEVHSHVVVNFISLDKGDNAVVGHAVVVHADPDDLKTQPSGNAGKRIGCGVVSMAEAMH